MQEMHHLDETPDPDQMPERVIAPLRDWLLHRQQWRGQTGIERVTLDRIALDYTIVVRDGHKLVGGEDGEIAVVELGVGRPETGEPPGRGQQP